jgi:hypothetical protein
MLYVTRGSTDLPLRGITFKFASEGVEDFMSSVMNIDNQDLISKMEGFAIQGMRGDSEFIGIVFIFTLIIRLSGAARNHQQHCSKIRSLIRQEINQALRKFKLINFDHILF